MSETKTTRWLCYLLEPPLLVFVEQPDVLIRLTRVPQGGDHFRWDGVRWRVRDVSMPEVDALGTFVSVEAVSGPLPVFQECPGCGGLMQCSDFCIVGLHRDPVSSAPRPFSHRPKKPRPPLLDAPLREIVARRGNVEELSCGHKVHFKFFKFVDKTATSRRCLECCNICEGVIRTVKRPQIF